MQQSRIITEVPEKYLHLLTVEAVTWEEQQVVLARQPHCWAVWKKFPVGQITETADPRHVIDMLSGPVIPVHIVVRRIQGAGDEVMDLSRSTSDVYRSLADLIKTWMSGHAHSQVVRVMSYSPSLDKFMIWQHPGNIINPGTDQSIDGYIAWLTSSVRNAATETSPVADLVG